ncbi:hypothetical protein J3A83DRAFT_4400579 [Scleroderma citrinum]
MESNGLKEICGWLNKGMSEQHSTDLGSVKHDSLTYILPPSQVFVPPIPKTEDKLMCRFNHPDIAHILCPHKKLNSLEEDPDIIIRALQEGQFNTGVMNWPMLFYEEGVYNPEDKCVGLFCSQAALWFYTHLFIGPSAAAMGTFISNTSKASKNRAWGLTQVSPFTIAYIHVVMYFTLSMAPQWCPIIGQMDLHELHWLIIELLNDKVDQWVCQTLAWWNS